MRVAAKAIFIPIIIAGLIGCASTNTVIAQGDNKAEKLATAIWHDDSKGGAYGIGEGWRIEVLSGRYEFVTEPIITYGDDAGLITIPAVYGWKKDETVGPNSVQEFRMEIVTIPPTFKTMTEQVIVEEAKTKYHITNPIYDVKGDILAPAIVERRYIPEITKQVERQVVDTPKRTIERSVLVEHREGYRHIVISPASTMEPRRPAKKRFETRRVETRPWRFPIRNPQGEIVHTFEDYDKLTAFIDSLK